MPSDNYLSDGFLLTFTYTFYLFIEYLIQQLYNKSQNLIRNSKTTAH